MYGTNTHGGDFPTIYRSQRCCSYSHNRTNRQIRKHRFLPPSCLHAGWLVPETNARTHACVDIFLFWRQNTIDAAISGPLSLMRLKIMGYALTGYQESCLARPKSDGIAGLGGHDKGFATPVGFYVGGEMCEYPSGVVSIPVFSTGKLAQDERTHTRL